MKTPIFTNPIQTLQTLAAWIGLTPKDHSTASKIRLGVISTGDEGLRSVLVVGATSVIQHAMRSGKASPWLAALLKRKPPKLAAVALANNRAHRLEDDADGEDYSTKSAATPARCGLEIGQTRGATELQPC